MRAGYIAIILGMLVAASFAFADENETTTTGPRTTYGTCVSEAAKLKNTCFENSRTTSGSCKATAEGQASKKAMQKECRTAYNAGKKTCKTDFKNAKMECAKTYKPNFFEKMRYSMA